MFTAGVAISVKFRIFGATLGTVNAAWVVTFNALAVPSASEVAYTTVPANSHKVFDKRGILLRVWKP